MDKRTSADTLALSAIDIATGRAIANEALTGQRPINERKRARRLEAGADARLAHALRVADEARERSARDGAWRGAAWLLVCIERAHVPIDQLPIDACAKTLIGRAIEERRGPRMLLKTTTTNAIRMRREIVGSDINEIEGEAGDFSNEPLDALLRREDLLEAADAVSAALVLASKRPAGPGRPRGSTRERADAIAELLERVSGPTRLPTRPIATPPAGGCCMHAPDGVQLDLFVPAAGVRTYLNSGTHCAQCGSREVYVRRQPYRAEGKARAHVGAYCAGCGARVRWINGRELARVSAQGGGV